MSKYAGTHKNIRTGGSPNDGPGTLGSMLPVGYGGGALRQILPNVTHEALIEVNRLTYRRKQSCPWCGRVMKAAPMTTMGFCGGGKACIKERDSLDPQEQEQLLMVPKRDPKRCQWSSLVREQDCIDTPTHEAGRSNWRLCARHAARSKRELGLLSKPLKVKVQIA